MQQDPRRQPGRPQTGPSGAGRSAPGQRQQQPQNRRTAQPPARPQTQGTQQAQNGYRSAAPYTVSPRQGGGRVPYPPSELERRRMLRRKQRRQRMLLLAVVCLLCLLLLAGLVTAAVFAIRQAVGTGNTDTPDSGAVPAVSDNAADTTAAPLPAETEPPLPEYAAPNRIDASPIRPTFGDSTVLLSDTVSCPHAILMNAGTGEVIAGKNAEDVIYPASMTKLMTVLVAYEMIPDIDETFRMTQDIIDPLYLDGLSLAGFSGGEEVVIRDLLYGSALPSGAEASMALALAACGSEEAFVRKMNDRAELLGMHGTHFENCTGAHHPEHVSTLYDIGILMAFMMQNETLAEILGTYQHTTTPTTQHPEGLVLTSTVFSRMEGSESGTCTVLGGKTGYTVQGGQCLATYAESRTDGKGFVCVTAGGDTKWRPVYDSIYLYQFYTADVRPTTPPPSIAPTE